MIAAISYTPIPIFEFGPINLSLHGVFAGLGFVAGAMLMIREVRRRGFDVEKVTSAITWGLVGSILGARLFTVPAHLSDPGYGFDNVIGLAGDFSILGGFAGGIIAGVWRFRRLDMAVMPHLDMAAAGLAIGAVIGRIGDLVIVEHLGSPTRFFLGFTVKAGYDIAPQHDALECLEGICGTYHHTALYDLIGSAVLLLALFALRKTWTGARYGQLFSVWMVWYGMQRFLIDFTRLGAAEDGTAADSVIGPFTGSQWGALAAAVGGVLLWMLMRRQPQVSSDNDASMRAIPADVES
ncbi:MAG: prolipoprotein diacylglyceryl transferase [Acidimicrobiia bacterium]|nr:prolipoprotein diacylglyceryl transferase [Acidimicrobiia bacterium]MDH3471303.1 prolipoprotein diacylglyceryl transferase [Acidimicrobiia bacterium]